MKRIDSCRVCGALRPTTADVLTLLICTLILVIRVNGTCAFVELARDYN